MPKEKTYVKKIEAHCQKMISERDEAIAELISYKKEICFLKSSMMNSYSNIISKIVSKLKESYKIRATYSPDKKHTNISSVLFESHVADLEVLIKDIQEIETRLNVNVQMDNRELERRIKSINTDEL